MKNIKNSVLYILHICGGAHLNLLSFEKLKHSYTLDISPRPTCQPRCPPPSSLGRLRCHQSHRTTMTISTPRPCGRNLPWPCQPCTRRKSLCMEIWSRLSIILMKKSSRSPSSAEIKSNPQRISVERHGAVRLGTPQELRTVRRIFAILGMRPVGYYDLALAGLPMHTTCFRPIGTTALEANSFRMFTTLLRPELLASKEARELAMQLLNKRRIFSDILLDLIDMVETQQNGHPTYEQGD